MIDARFDGSFAGWREVARGLLAGGVRPDDVAWSAGDDWQPGLTALDWGSGPETNRRLRVPRRFLDLADAVACHRDPARWAVLYRVLWRLTTDAPHLLAVVTDPDVHRLTMMERAVRRSSHKMKAFVRFRAVERAESDHPVYVAWFEPMHHVVERTAPFFARRFASMQWSVLTPDRCAHWDRARLQFTAGVSRRDAPDPDAVLEDLWCAYYAHIFNPARLMPDAMRAEMPKEYWRNLPEAALIPELMRDAPRRLARMIARSAEAPEVIPGELDGG